ncbi:MAG: ABC transporter substrate-binding protein, partial [Euryarchaeota archaeon]|nr:ABC transporter substrate-binding protein [Euryarchaeota archaeon]
ESFQERHPGVERIFYETLPPGLELRQILAGGARFQDRIIPGRPDIYTAVTEDAMVTLKERGLVGDYSVYLHNRLVLMVAAGNPKGITGVEDLARDDVRVSQPGEMEDITKYILEMYRKAGGEELVERIMEQKRAEATTIFTIVHHRETPLRITRGTADVGPVWATEVENARRQGLKLEAVEVGPDLDQHDAVNYYIAMLEGAKNRENARAFMDFIFSREAQEIYRKYGFVPGA